MDKETATNGELAFLEGGGEIGALMRSYNWKSHPLGDPAHWPMSLKNNIRLMLGSGFPMFIWWSKNLYMFHNDPYIPALGEKHPEALGASAYVMWAEIWDDLWSMLGGNIDSILNEGKHFYAEDLIVVLKRRGFLEETYWTFSYSPAYNDDSSIGGLFCACTEVTKKVLGARRLRTIKGIAEVTAQRRTISDTGKKISQVLKENSRDIPFCLFYLYNDQTKKASLMVNTGGLPPEGAPEAIDLVNPFRGKEWPLAKIIKTGNSEVISDFSDNYWNYLSDEWKEAVREVVIVPVFGSGKERIAGFLISGISPKLKYDDDYQNFIELTANQIEIAFINASNLEKDAEILKIKTNAENNLRNLFAQAPVAISIFKGPDFTVELANSKALEVWGKTKEQVINKRVLEEVFPELINQGFDKILSDVYTTGESFIAKQMPVIIQKNGKPETLYINFTYDPFYNTEGNIVGIVGLGVDVTELVSKNEELIKINNDLDNFIYTASHDLKAPVSNIEGLVNVLKDLGEKEEYISRHEALQIIEMINQSINRFKSTVLDLTEITKVQKGEEELQEVNCALIVEDVLHSIRDIIEESHARISVDLSNCTLRFSKKNFKSIVYNLISNAIKYRDKTRRPEIKVKSEITEDYTILTVQDNGLGLSKENQAKMFSMFKRFHDHVEGTGIGLYIVKRIISNAGGKIEVESEEGKGTTFRVYFSKNL